MLRRTIASSIASSKRLLPRVKSVNLAACFSSSTAKDVSSKPSNASSSSKLMQVLSSEIKAQQDIFETNGEDLNPSTIVSEYSQLFKDHQWNFKHEDGSTTASLTRQEGMGTIQVKFDVKEIVDCYNNASLNEFEDDNVEASEEEEFKTKSSTSADKAASATEEDFSEFDESDDYQSIPFSLEFVPQSNPRTLKFDCLAEVCSDSSNISIENVSIESSEAAASDSQYPGPNFSDLDESLQEALEKYVKKLLIKPDEVLSFMASYSHASESHLYDAWLNSFKTLLTPSKN